VLRILNFINGEFLESCEISSSGLEVFEPATGSVYAILEDSSPKDVDLAVGAAREAFKTWKKTTLEERARVMREIASGIRKNSERLAAAESRDQGKPISLARSVDIPRAASNFDFFASAIEQSRDHSFHNEEGVFHYSKRKPVGVAGLISPWNLPLYLLTWKIAPAIACGNTVVAKCSELTPMTANILCEIIQKSSLPKGVVNLVHGSGLNVGRAICAHPEIPLISFTGSTQTALDIQKQAAVHFKKLSLELGGKNPTLIFEDCDYEQALNTAVRASFTNQGEICLCGSRLYVQSSIREKFVKDFVELAKTWKPGDPSREETKMGALVSKEHREKVLSYIEKARDLGGEIICGGKVPQFQSELDGGYFVEPTVITGLKNSCAVIQEEIFGPVVTIGSFDTEAQAIELANDSKYGLSASVWTTDLGRAQRVSQNLEAGMVWVNTWMKRDLRTPFGGVKASGVGREGGEYSLEFYTEEQNITLCWDPVLQ